MYLESFGNPRRFTEIAKRVGAEEADPDRQVRAHRRRGARRLEPHRRARRRRRHGLGLPRPVRRAARRHHRGAVRHRARPRPLPAARGARGWRSSPTPAGRRIMATDACVNLGLADGRALAPATRAAAARASCRRGLARQPGRHDRLGDRRRSTPRTVAAVLADPGVDAALVDQRHAAPGRPARRARGARSARGRARGDAAPSRCWR